MYIAEAWKDDRSGSETEGFIIGKHVETLDRFTVAPPVESNYTPMTTTTPHLIPIDPLVIGVVAVVAIVAVVVIFWIGKSRGT